MIEARKVSFAKVSSFREQFLSTLDCQYVRYSILPRGLADCYVITLNQQPIGYAGIWNDHFPGRIMEIYREPHLDVDPKSILDVLKTTAAATEIEAQSNIKEMFEFVAAGEDNLRIENLLFRDDGLSTPTRRPMDGLVFRERRQGDHGPEGEWVIATGGQVLAAGGILRHYNPPFVDLYMEVFHPFRRKGIGSYLINRMIYVCRENGEIASARCDHDNRKSEKTLLRGGLRRCGEIVVMQL